MKPAILILSLLVAGCAAKPKTSQTEVLLERNRGAVEGASGNVDKIIENTQATSQILHQWQIEIEAGK